MLYSVFINGGHLGEVAADVLLDGTLRVSPQAVQVQLYTSQSVL